MYVKKTQVNEINSKAEQKCKENTGENSMALDQAMVALIFHQSTQNKRKDTKLTTQSLNASAQQNDIMSLLIFEKM